jgi:hypothetical protein
MNLIFSRWVRGWFRLLYGRIFRPPLNVFGALKADWNSTVIHLRIGTAEFALVHAWKIISLIEKSGSQVKAVC